MLSKPHPLRLIKIRYLKSTFHAAFTRTLAALYSSTLLCLLTTLQLALLARGKYVSAVLRQELLERLQERMQERMERETGLGSLLLRSVGR